MKISINDLADTITSELTKYNQTVTDNLKDNIKETAEETKDELKANSPKRTGKYKKGWRVKEEFENRSDIRLVVHNKTSYQLTHLLERPHVISNGTKRIFGTTKAQPHIEIAEQNAIKKLENKIKVVVKG